MTDNNKVLPGIVLRSIGGGLLLMTLFTMMWASIGHVGMDGRFGNYVYGFFIGLSIAFFINGIRFLFKSRSMPPVQSEEDRMTGKRMGQQFGIIFGIEGTAIPIACGLLVWMGLSDYILPVIALIVGLHFYPMAKVFNRKIDYYIATWTCAVAIYCIYYTTDFTGAFLTKTDGWRVYPPHEAVISQMMAMLGTGVTIATSAYGIYMLREGKKILDSLA